MRTIRIGTRESRLAVEQARLLQRSLEQRGIGAELVTMKTTGDRILDRALDQVGGKGLFVKELDRALREGRCDVTVHSCKDLPMEEDPALPLVAFSRREDPRDALVLPLGQAEIDWAKPVGCASPRRSLQLRALYPGIQVAPIRGNVTTRLQKLDEGQFSALILAAAGLKRLGLEERISRYFAPEEMIPAAGQGVLCVQGRAGEDYSCLEPFFDRDAAVTTAAERAFVTALDGGCSSPVAAFAHVEDGEVLLRGLYYSERLDTYTTGEARGPAGDAVGLGRALAARLRQELEGGDGR